MYIRKQKNKKGKYIYFGSKRRIKKETYYKNLQFQKYEKIARENKLLLSQKRLSNILRDSKNNGTSIKKEFDKYTTQKRKEKISYIKRTYNVNPGIASEILNLSIAEGTNYGVQAEMIKNEGEYKEHFDIETDDNNWQGITNYIGLRDAIGGKTEYFINIDIPGYKYAGDISGVNWQAFRSVMESMDSGAEGETGTTYGVMEYILNVDYTGGLPENSTGVSITLV